MVKSRYIGDGHPTFHRNPYNWYIKPYYWVDEFIRLSFPSPIKNGNVSWELIDSTRPEFLRSSELVPTVAGRLGASEGFRAGVSI